MPQSSSSSTPARASATRTAAGRSNAGVPVARPAFDLGPELRDEPFEIARAELVALDVDARAEERAHVVRALPACRRVDGRVDDPGRETAVAGMDNADRVVGREDDRCAVGGHDRERESGVRVTDASATGALRWAGSRTACTSAPCTWSSQIHSLGSGRPAAAAIR